MKRSKQRTRHSSIPLFLTTRFCTSVAPPPPPSLLLLSFVCVSVSLSTQQISSKLFSELAFDIQATTFFFFFFFFFFAKLPPAQNPKHSRIEETTAMRIKTAKTRDEDLALANTTANSLDRSTRSSGRSPVMFGRHHQRPNPRAPPNPCCRPRLSVRLKGVCEEGGGN